ERLAIVFQRLKNRNRRISELMLKRRIDIADSQETLNEKNDKQDRPKPVLHQKKRENREAADLSEDCIVTPLRKILDVDHSARAHEVGADRDEEQRRECDAQRDAIAAATQQLLDTEGREHRERERGRERESLRDRHVEERNALQ